MLSTKVTGKKLGFIGFGRIAQAVAQKAHFGFGMEVSFYDPYPPSDEIIKKFSAKKFDTLEDVLKDSDYVTLHCPGGGDNTNLMNKERFSLMKKSAFLINTARGDLGPAPPLQADQAEHGTRTHARKPGTQYSWPRHSCPSPAPGVD